MQGPVVIVGAGQAGAWVAMTLRELQPGRRIVLIGDEPHPPYERPPLSKDVLAGKAPPESAYLRPHDYYAERDIELMLATRVERIDRKAKRIVCDDGSTLDYQVLVLSTGMRARALPVPGADHPCVRSLRAMADVEGIGASLREGRKIVAIGAGFIGLEVAAVAVEAGCDVTVVESALHALGRVVDPAVADALAARHAQRGVRFRYGTRIASVSDNCEGARVSLADGEEIAADLVLCGIGGMPNDELAREAGLVCDGGIVVDAAGRTSDPAIFSVGDVTLQHSLALDRPVRLESWQNAQNQAIAVAKKIAGAPEPYADLPWFWTDQYDNNFQIIGAPERWDRLVWRGRPEDDKFTAIYMSGDRVVAGNALNNARDIRTLKVMILSRRPIADSVLADTSVSLQKLQKMQVAS